MRFVFDENLPEALAEVVRILLKDESQHRVDHIRADLGMGGVSDPEWLNSLSDDEYWVIITRDNNIRKRPQEREAWKSKGHIIFFLAKGWSHQQVNDQLWMITRWWPVILETAKWAKAGDGYIIPCRGTPSSLRNLQAD